MADLLAQLPNTVEVEQLVKEAIKETGPATPSGGGGPITGAAVASLTRVSLGRRGGV